MMKQEMTRMNKKNKQVKNIIQVGIITIMSLAAAFPVFRNISGHDLRLDGKEPSAIYTYNSVNLQDIVSEDIDVYLENLEAAQNGEIIEPASTGYAAEATTEIKPYMSYIPDAYDPDLLFKDVEKHLTDARPEEFSDPYIYEEALNYSEQGYKLINSEYAIKYYGQGLGFGDYAFTNGFSFKDSPEDEFFVFDIVKATQEEFDAYLEEFKEGRTLVDYYDCEEYTSMRTSESEPYYEITYYKDKEILIQETYFMYN